MTLKFKQRRLSSGRAVLFPGEWEQMLAKLTPTDIRAHLDTWLANGSPLGQNCTIKQPHTVKGTVRIFTDQMDSIRQLGLTVPEAIRQCLAWQQTWRTATVVVVDRDIENVRTDAGPD